MNPDPFRQQSCNGGRNGGRCHYSTIPLFLLGADFTGFGLNRQDAKYAKGFWFFPDRGKTDQEKATPDYILSRTRLPHVAKHCGQVSLITLFLFSL